MSASQAKLPILRLCRGVQNEIPARMVIPVQPVMLTGFDPNQTAHYVAFEQFVEFFCAQFKNPHLVADVNSRQSYKDYIFDYFRRVFTVPVRMTSRHVRWFRRLLPVLSLPVGSRILDYGGGYGLDSIYLASRGYRMTILELSPHHLAICQHLTSKFAAAVGNLEISYVLGRLGFETILDHPMEAVLLDEVAHHIEPPQELFVHCARLLRRGGTLFLLEPNPWNLLTQTYFFRVRGFKTVIQMRDESTGRSYLYGNEHIRSRARWTILATRAGFQLAEASYICPYFQQARTFRPGPLRAAVESIPGIRSLAASHISYSFVSCAF